MGCIPVIYNSTHWWNMYPDHCYNENQLLKFISEKKIPYDKFLAEKSIEYVKRNYIKIILLILFLI